MAKESKKDRLVKQVSEQMSEHLIELKAIERNPSNREIDVERWVQSFLRNCLGFSATNGYQIRAQELRGKSRPDLLICRGEEIIFVVEVKKLGFDFDRSEFRSGKVQLEEYLNALGKVQYGLLCNGYAWKLFEFNHDTDTCIEINEFDLRNEEDAIDTSKKCVEEIAYEMIEFHENYMDSWREFAREAIAFSPESLAKAILSNAVVKQIAKAIKGEHELNAGMDLIYSKILWLVEKGLDDVIVDYDTNEKKRAEFQKYIRSELKALKKAKRLSAKKRASAEERDKKPEMVHPGNVLPFTPTTNGPLPPASDVGLSVIEKKAA